MTVLTVVGAERPPGGIKAGVVITAEGGIEGTQVYRYDAEGKPMAGTPAKSRSANPLPRSSSAGTVAPSPTAPAPAAPKVDQTIRTADGRTVPFARGNTGLEPRFLVRALDLDAVEPHDLGHPVLTNVPPFP